MAKSSQIKFDDPKTPDDILFVLDALANANCIIIGGQAINIWSIRLEQTNQEPWKSNRPYTSSDADGLGDVLALTKLAQALKSENYAVEVQLAEKPEEKWKNTGVINASSKDLNISINILNNPEGLRHQEVVTTAQPVAFKDKTLKVLHPLLCVEGKASCLIQLPQNDPTNPRQDEKHLILSLANLRVYLEQIGHENPEDAVKIAKRIPVLALGQLGVEIRRLHEIDLLDGVPWEAWQKSTSTVLQEFGNELEAIQAQRNEAIERDFELKKWIKGLQDKSSKPKMTAADAKATIHKAAKNQKKSR